MSTTFSFNLQHWWWFGSYKNRVKFFFFVQLSKNYKAIRQNMIRAARVSPDGLGKCSREKAACFKCHALHAPWFDILENHTLDTVYVACNNFMQLIVSACPLWKRCFQSLQIMFCLSCRIKILMMPLTLKERYSSWIDFDVATRICSYFCEEE